MAFLPHFSKILAKAKPQQYSTMWWLCASANVDDLFVKFYYYSYVFFTSLNPNKPNLEQKSLSQLLKLTYLHIKWMEP